MKVTEKEILKVVKIITKKSTIDPRIPGCLTIYHQPKRPRK